MADTSFDINNGANQIAPNAMTQNQYFYGEEFARKILGSKDKPLSLIVLGKYNPEPYVLLYTGQLTL